MAAYKIRESVLATHAGLSSSISLGVRSTQLALSQFMLVRLSPHDCSGC